MTLDELLADATARKDAAEAKHTALEAAMRELQKQVASLNAQGVALEKEQLGIAGELKALTALKESA